MERAFEPGSGEPGVANDARWPAGAWGDPAHDVKFAFFLVAEFVSSFSRLLDVELPIFGVVTVLFYNVRCIQKICAHSSKFLHRAPRNNFRDPPEFLMNQGLQGPW